ncbi:MAG: TetR family transcriptional regulator [Saprospiraceae bacterium]
MPDLHPSDRNGTRRHMLEIAEQLFSKHGFEAVSVRQLAAEAGVNSAMVSYHFKSKDGLLRALIQERFPRTREQIDEIANNSALDPMGKLLAAVDMYAEKFFDSHAFHRIIMREMSLSQRPEHVKSIIDHFAYILGVIRGFISDGQKQGFFRPVDIELTLATVFGSFSTLIGQGSLMCMMLGEDCEDNIYSEKSRTRFTAHLKELLRILLMRN